MPSEAEADVERTKGNLAVRFRAQRLSFLGCARPDRKVITRHFHAIPILINEVKRIVGTFSPFFLFLEAPSHSLTCHRHLYPGWSPRLGGG